MKIVILSGILFLLFVNILAQKTITCKKETIQNYPTCLFSGVTLGPNEAVTIKTNPENLDVNSITRVDFDSSSIHSVPSEIFTKFSNLRVFRALGQNIQEIYSETFLNGKKLEWINLDDNHLIFLHLDTLKGEF
jgi:hypothetical protein